MNDTNQKKLGQTLWSIADQLRGAMDADDFRDYMLSFLFLRYLSDNYEAAAKKELGKDYPAIPADDPRVPLAIWYANNPADTGDFEKQMRRKVHYVIQARPPLVQHRQHGPHPAWRAAEHATGGLQIHSRKNPSRAPLMACSPRLIWPLRSWARPTPTGTPSFAPSSKRSPRG
jgi:hypothetical protein